MITCRQLLLLSLVAALQACGEKGPEFYATDNPLRLSAWNLFSITEGAIEPSANALVFQPQNTLFTDYAHKLRTMWVPEGSRISLEDGRFEYPVGTILSKTFYYPINSDGEFLRSEDPGNVSMLQTDRYRLMETRLLVRRTAGWEAFPYVWNEEQTEAFLRVAGASLSVSLVDDSVTQQFTYFVPNENQCGGCHTRIHPDGGLEPLGAVAHQLNHSPPGTGPGEGTILAAMQEQGWLPPAPPPEHIPSWQDEALPLEDRAAAYLDMNCGHCHNPRGAADTSALLLDGFTRSARERGLCKPPVAAGGGAGDRRYGIVPGRPDESILLYRMQSVQPDEMMPELGRALVHEEGVDLINRWIASIPGDCG